MKPGLKKKKYMCGPRDTQTTVPEKSTVVELASTTT